jgi:hypothetical protein
VSEKDIFKKRVADSNALRPIRDRLSGLVLNDHALLPCLLDMVFDISDKNHHKACWILELVLEAKIEWLEPHLDIFCSVLPEFRSESALRSVSKICLFAVEHHKKHYDFLNGLHYQQIIEACFDWLIKPETKVATKAYAMRALYILGKNEDWIYPELQRILSEDAAKHSAAYIAAAKGILQRLNK